MAFSFETLPLDNKEILRQSILSLFGRDIATVPCAFSSRNYAFIFDEGCFPAIIRVGKETPYRKMEDILSELMWIDDLKNDIATICQPLPSLGNRLVERITVGATVYLVTMFRKANGAVFPEKEWNAAHFYNMGVLLGKIHRTSSEGYARGFRYKRKHWDAYPFYDVSIFDAYFEPSARKNAEAVIQRIKSIPRDPRWYGMIYGDFQNGNLFCDWGTLWAFDFDDCCYGYFLFDIACMAHICICAPNYAKAHADMTTRERLLGANGILTQIRAGYSTEYQLPDEHWDLFHDFFRLRVIHSTGIQLAHQLFPREVLVALLEPMCDYLKDDMPPVDRIDAVERETVSRLTPDMMRSLENLLASALG